MLAFATLILGFLIAGVTQLTNVLIQDTFEDIIEPNTFENNTTTTAATRTIFTSTQIQEATARGAGSVDCLTLYQDIVAG